MEKNHQNPNIPTNSTIPIPQKIPETGGFTFEMAMQFFNTLNSGIQMNLGANDSRVLGGFQMMNNVHGVVGAAAAGGGERRDAGYERDYEERVKEQRSNVLEEFDRSLRPAVTPPPQKSFQCFICLETNPEEFLKKLTLPEEKLIIATGCVLRNELTIQRAHGLLIGRNARKFVCRRHVSRVIQSIFNVLNIENAAQILTCSFNYVHELMRIVNSLQPDCKIWQFCNFLNNYVIRNTERVRESPKPRKTPPRSHTCVICHHKRDRKSLKSVTIKNEFLILLTARLLRDEMTLEHAKHQFLSTNYVFVCHAHFQESIDEMLKIFDLTNPNRVVAKSLFNILMVSVKYICPHITDFQFVQEFLEFGKRAKKQQQLRG